MRRKTCNARCVRSLVSGGGSAGPESLDSRLTLHPSLKSTRMPGWYISIYICIFTLIQPRIPRAIRPIDTPTRIAVPIGIPRATQSIAKLAAFRPKRIRPPPLVGSGLKKLHAYKVPDEHDNTCNVKKRSITTHITCISIKRMTVG